MFLSNLLTMTKPKLIAFEPDVWFTNMLQKLDSLQRKEKKLYDTRQELKLACKVLQHQRDKYQALSEASDCGIIIYRDEKVIVVNPILEKMLGYSEQELMDNIELLNKCYSEKDLKIVKQHKYTKDMSSYIVSVIHKNGISTKVLLHPKLVNYNGHGLCRAVCVTKYKEGCACV